MRPQTKRTGVEARPANEGRTGAPGAGDPHSKALAADTSSHRVSSTAETRTRRPAGLFAWRVSDRVDGIEPPLAGHALSSCVPRSSNSIPEPATRSLTVEETSTSPAEADDAIRAPVATAIPATLLSWSSHSPVCTPARSSRPSSLTPPRIACAAPNRARRTVESCEEAVTRRVPLLAPEACELASHERVMLREKVAPGLVAGLRRALGGANQVREQKRCEHTVRHFGPRIPTQEGLDCVGGVDTVVLLDGQAYARELDDPRTRDALCDELRRAALLPLREDEARNADGRKHVGDIRVRESCSQGFKTTLELGHDSLPCRRSWVRVPASALRSPLETAGFLMGLSSAGALEAEAAERAFDLGHACSDSVEVLT
jgi:hypothetical protein